MTRTLADISVIIPTRDRLWCLPRAVESCRSHQLNIQIIVVDDASADGTAEWLKQQGDVVTIPGDGWGKPWAVNAALACATGTYLRFLDSDDWLNAGANETQYEIAVRTKADVVIGGLDVYRDEAFVETHPWPSFDDFVEYQLGINGHSHHYSHYSACLFRREFVAGIPHRTAFPASRFASADDQCFLLEVALRHPRIAVSESSSLCFRQHLKARLTNQRGAVQVCTVIQVLGIYRQILRILEQRGELTERRRKAAAKTVWRVARAIGVTHLEEGADAARWVFELDRDFWPDERGLPGWLFRSFQFSHAERILRPMRMARTLVRRIGAMFGYAALLSGIVPPTKSRPVVGK